MAKITEQDKIEAENLENEIKEILKPCINCGMCKANCSVFKILREEAKGPRGKAILLNNDIFDRIVFECNLCKACEEKCPLNIKLCSAFEKAREVLVLRGKELKENKEMISNIRKTGNPFGRIEGKIDKFYCC